MEGPSWEPGSLPTREIERILIDALADLWRDGYRRGTAAEDQRRFQEFRRKTELALYSATGRELWITRNFGERG